MKMRLLASLIIAATATMAHAQNSAKSPLIDHKAQTMLPIWNTLNGKMEGIMLLDADSISSNGSRTVIRPANSLAALNIPLTSQLKFSSALSLSNNPGLGLVCNGQPGLFNSLGNLAQNCRIGDLLNPNNNFGSSRPDLIMQSQLRYKNFMLAAGGNWSQFNFNAFNGNGKSSNSGVSPRVTTATVQQKEISLNGEVSIGQKTWLHLGGTLAQARIIPASQLAGRGLIPDEWQTNSISIGAGHGNFGGEITGSDIQIPGQSNSFKTVGAGVTWKTPWRGKLSVGADNINSSGNNPFKSNDNNPLDNGAVPFVKYEVDL
ncbi:MAG: hypothetical protein ABI644_03325 [Arenimonas sp.]